jgi:hypothetical protein
MKLLNIVLFICVLFFSCTSKQQNMADFIKMKNIIDENSNFFKNNSDDIPCLFSKYYIQNDPGMNFTNRQNFVDLLEKNNINQIYISTSQEIWFVIETKHHMLSIVKYLLGYSNNSDIKKFKINYYRTKRIKSIGNGWYTAQLTFSMAD